MVAGGPAGRFSFKKTTSLDLLTRRRSPGCRERARGPPTGVRGGGTPAPARVAVCCGHLLRDAPRAAPNAAAAAGRAACPARAGLAPARGIARPAAVSRRSGRASGGAGVHDQRRLDQIYFVCGRRTNHINRRTQTNTATRHDHEFSRRVSTRFTPATPFAATPLQRLRRHTHAARREVARSEHGLMLLLLRSLGRRCAAHQNCFEKMPQAPLAPSTRATKRASGANVATSASRLSPGAS